MWQSKKVASKSLLEPLKKIHILWLALAPQAFNASKDIESNVKTSCRKQYIKILLMHLPQFALDLPCMHANSHIGIEAEN